MSAPSSFDEFRRRVGSSKAPSFALPLVLHGALALALAIALWGSEDRLSGSVADVLVTNTAFGKLLIGAGLVTLIVTAALGHRVLRPSEKPRWRWPIAVPALVLALGMLPFFSSAAKGASELGGAHLTVGHQAAFEFSSFALGIGASIARVGFAFAAVSLSLAGWVLAISALGARPGGSVRLMTVPAICLAGGVVGAALFGASPLHVWVGLAIGAAGIVVLFLTRSAPGTEEGAGDLAAAGVCLAAAAVLAALYHWANPIVGAVRVGELRQAALDAIGSFANELVVAERTQRAGLLVALGALLATAGIVASRSTALAGGLRRAGLTALPALVAAIVPLAAVRHQIGTAAGSMIASTKSPLPSDLELARSSAKPRRTTFSGDALRIGHGSASIGPTHPASPMAELTAPAACQTFAERARRAHRVREAAVAIDRRARYENVACLLGALDRELPAELAVLGRTAADERLPAPFEDADPPLPSWPVRFSSDAGSSDKSLYAAKTDGWHLGSVAAPSSLDAALSVLAANAGGGDVEYDRGPFYLSAHPDTPWEVVLDGVARVSELGSVVLQPARSSPTPAEPNTEPAAESDTEAEPELPPVPTGKVTIGGVDGEGPAPARKLRAELAKRTSKLEKCYADALDRNPGTGGAFTATVVFSTDGTVSSVKKKASTVREATLLGCAASALYEMRLGAEAEPTTFTVTLRFELGVE